MNYKPIPTSQNQRIMVFFLRFTLSLFILTFGFTLSGQDHINYDSIQPKLIAAEGPHFVFSMARTSDAKYMAVAGGNNVTIWEISSGKLIHKLIGHSTSVLYLQIAPDDKHVVTGSLDGSAIIWEISTGKMVRILTGHSDQIRSLDISHDGQYVATGSRDNSAIIWDFHSGEILHHLKGHFSTIEAISFDPYNKYVVTASADSTAIIWKLTSGEILHRLDKHTESIISSKISPDGKFLITGGYDTDVLVWELATGNLVHQLKGHKGLILTVEVSQNGQYIISGSSDKSVKVWDMKTGKLVHHLDGHIRKIRSISNSPNGEYIVAAGRDSVALVWNLNTGKLVHELKSPAFNDLYWITTTFFSPDGKYVFTGSLFEKIIRKWDLSTGELVCTFEGYTSTINSAQVSPNCKYFTSSRYNGKTGVWNFSTGQLMKSFEGDFGLTLGSLFSHNGHYLLTVHWDSHYDSGSSSAILWDVATGNKVYSFEGQTNIWSFVISPNDNYVVTGSTDSTAIVWEISTGKQKYKLVHSSAVTSLDFSSNGKHLVSGTGNGEIFIWDILSGKLLYKIHENSSLITDLSISSDGKYLCAASKDSTAIICDFKTGELLYHLKGHLNRVKFISIDSSNNFVITGSGDNTAIIWELTNGVQKYKLENHTSEITSLTISPDGVFVATGGDDNSVTIWEISTGKIMHKLVGHSENVRGLHFSPNGKYILTASSDGSIIFWNYKTGKQLIRLFPLPDDNWIALHPSGLFDATSEAMKWMHYVVGMEVVELEQLKERYYEPGLFEKAMSQSANLRDVEGFGSLKMYPQIESYIKDDELYIHLKERNGGIGKISLFVNNKEVIPDANANRDTSLRIDLQQFKKYYVQDTINIISFRAYNSDGWLKSRAYEHNYQAEFLSAKGEVQEGLKPLRVAHEPHLYAVIVGTSDYSGDALDLQFADKDSKDMAYAIEQSGGMLFGKENVHLSWFTSTGMEESSIGSKKNIKKAFDSIAVHANPEDIMLVYFSGHGVNYGSPGDEQFYYLTKDISSGIMTDPEIRSNYTISTDEMTQWITSNAAQKQVMILDACSSGQVVENLLAVRNVPSSQIRALDRMKDRTGMFVLAGSAADKVSYEASQFGQGLLTYSLLLGMDGAALKDGQSVDVMNLFQYSRDQVPKFANDIGGVQTPTLAVPTDASSFDIGLVTDEIEIPLQEVKPLFSRSTLFESESWNDVLQISKSLDSYLIDKSSGTQSKGIIFVDVNAYANAYSIKGQYNIEDDKVYLQGRLFKGDKRLDDFEVEGSREDKEKLLDDILNHVVEIVNR